MRRPGSLGMSVVVPVVVLAASLVPAASAVALAGLRALDDPAVDTAMSISDAGIALDRKEFPTVWFKGGAEPGVLTFNYLTRTAEGRTLTASVMLTDPTGELAPRTADEALALIRGGLELA